MSADLVAIWSYLKMIDQQTIRSRILEIVNTIITVEDGPIQVKDVRIVDAPAFFDDSYGTSILEEDGSIVLRIATRRSLDQVADTVLHETAHILLGPEHVDQPDHGEEFQGIYARLRREYMGVVEASLNGL